MKDEFDFDVGDNIEGLGYTFLFLRYVFPTLIGVGIILSIYFFLKHIGFDILAIRIDNINFLP